MLVHSLFYVDDIIAHLLKLENDIHVVHAGGVVVLLLGDVLHVLRLQFVAEVIDLVLHVGHL